MLRLFPACSAAFVGNESEVDRYFGLGWNCVHGLRADFAGGKPADVDGRAHRALRQAIVALGSADAEFPFEGVLDGRKFRDCGFLGFAERVHVIEEARDKDASIAVAHGCDQPSRHHCRIGRPAARSASPERTDRSSIATVSPAVRRSGRRTRRYASPLALCMYRTPAAASRSWR